MAFALIALGALVCVAVSWNRAFQIDEVEHLHAGYHVASGRLPYVDFWQLHDPLLYGLLGPLTDPDDPRASYRRGRGLLLLVLAGTVLSAALTARRLAGGPAGALTAGLLLLHTTFVERAIEVRPDGVAALLVAAALALQLGERRERSGQRLCAGALLGLALLTTKKSVYLAAVFGVWWSIEAWRRRKLAPLAPALGMAAVGLVAVLTMLGLGIFEGYTRATWSTSLDAASGSNVWITFSPTLVLSREVKRNLMFLVVAAVGWVSALWLSRRGPQRRLLFPALFATAAVASLWLQPFPWPYVHVGVLPAVAVIAGAGSLGALERAPEAWRRRAWTVVAGILLVVALSVGPRLFRSATPDPGAQGQSRQLALLDEVQQATGAQDPVFDMAGFYFRPDGYPAYSMSSDVMRLMHAGGLPPLLDELRRNGVVAMLVNYRVDWLEGEEREFFAYRFVHRTDNLFVLGADLADAPTDTDLSWEALAERPFRWEGPPGALSVDGRPFDRGTLSRGLHTLRLREGTTGRLVLDSPPLLGAFRPAEPLYIQFD